MLVNHCIVHKLELGVLDAFKKVSYLKQFEETLKHICKYDSFSSRNIDKHLGSVLHEAIIMSTENKAIRWVSSKTQALQAVCQDIHVIVTYMEQIVSNPMPSWSMQRLFSINLQNL